VTDAEVCGNILWKLLNLINNEQKHAGSFSGGNAQTSESVSITNSTHIEVPAIPRRINLEDYKRRTKIYHKDYGYGIIVSQLESKIIVLFLDGRTVNFYSYEIDEFDIISESSMCEPNTFDILNKKYS